MSVIGRRGRAKIIVFLIAVCTVALVYLPPYERFVYSKSEVNKADIEEDSDYMAIGCKGGDDITVLDASEMSKEEICEYEGIFVLKIDAKNLEPLGIYRPAGFSSGKAGYIENRFKVFWERMDDAYAQYYLATFADGEKMAIMINDRTFHVPSCQTAHCGRRKLHFDFGRNTSPIVPYRHLPQTLRGLTADCCSLV